MADSSAVFTEDGAWCWFQDPRAVRHVGERDRTYTGWVTRAGDIEVGSYDHRTGAVETSVLHADFERDDHDAPALFVDGDGRLLVFYTAHAGPAIHYRRSADPEDVTAFGPEQTIAPSSGHTYPSPRSIDGRLHLFYRNGEGSVAAVVSDDAGRSWSDERVLLTTGGREWCVYRKISAVHDGGVDLGLTFAAGGTSHPHRDIRHVRFDGERLLTAAGDPLDAEGTPTFRDAPVVYDSGATGHDAWIWDCAVVDGTPRVAYAELRAEDDHGYRYARWTGGRWRDAAVADAGSHVTSGNDETYYSGGIALDRERPGVCYYSTGDYGGSRLRRAVTRDGGRTWAAETVADGGVQHVRPVVPRGRRDDLPVLWLRGDYTGYRGDYQTAVVGLRAN